MSAYSRLPAEDGPIETFISDEKDDAGDNLLDNEILTPQKPRLFGYSALIVSLTIANIALFIAYCSMFVINLQKQQLLDDICFDKHAFYSPLNAAVDHRYHLVQFNGTLDAESPYRGPPSPEIDAAWEAVSDVGWMNVSANDILSIKQSLDSVRFAPEYGDGGYVVGTEVFHQLHCLNFLRMSTYRDYYHDKALEFTDPEHIVRKHQDHCIEMLRQNLMCNADTGVITNQWVENHTAWPYPNFNTWHMCRNFEDIQREVRERKVEFNGEDPYARGSGVRIFPTPP